MTPAEILAANQPRKRAPRNKAAYKRKLTWECCLSQLRESLSLSIEVVADAVKLSKTSYWQIEQGTDPMLTNARRIAEFFGKPIEEIWPKKRKP